MKNSPLVSSLKKILINTMSESNGIPLKDTLGLMLTCPSINKCPEEKKYINEFKKMLGDFQNDALDIEDILKHPLAEAIFDFFKSFPLPFYEEHIHLTGSLSAEFIFPKLKKLLEGPHKEIYEEKIIEIYGKDALPIKTIEDVNNLIRLKNGEHFDQYLKILTLPKLVLTDKNAHIEAAYHMASELYHNFNVGHIRLKFTLSRANNLKDEKVEGISHVSPEDTVLGLYEGFSKFKKEQPKFNFILSPSFRKESDFYDAKNFKSKTEDFNFQIETILGLLEKYPDLSSHLTEIDTVGNERGHYRKKHFLEMKEGLRKLQFMGLQIRSHHGETWNTLKKGIQSVDNAMNIWQIDTLEHGLSLGINPNFYFHRLYQKTLQKNMESKKILPHTKEFAELEELNWKDERVLDKLKEGIELTPEEINEFLKAKFHTAVEIESYQHDILNRMISKKISLVTLPSSNLKLTKSIPDFKDHPFSWWEKKGVSLGIGTDNYVTLNTNFIKEMLILLVSDYENLKIMKLLMVATRETRRNHLSHLLWKMKDSI